MEEDIKILEEKIKALDTHIKNYEKNDCKTSIYEQLVREKQAIENILADRETLIAEVKKWKEAHDYVYEAYQDAGKKLFDYEDKIKAKIEEIHNKKYKDIKLDSATIDFCCIWFKELLGE